MHAPLCTPEATLASCFHAAGTLILPLWTNSWSHRPGKTSQAYIYIYIYIYICMCVYTYIYIYKQITSIVQELCPVGTPALCRVRPSQDEARTPARSVEPAGQTARSGPQIRQGASFRHQYQLTVQVSSNFRRSASAFYLYSAKRAPLNHFHFEAN